MTIKELNKKRKWRPCLGCGISIFTDRCHRFCRLCLRRMKGGYYKPPAKESK